MATMDELILLSQAGISIKIRKESLTEVTPEGPIIEVEVDGQGAVQLIGPNDEEGFKYTPATWMK